MFDCPENLIISEQTRFSIYCKNDLTSIQSLMRWVDWFRRDNILCGIATKDSGLIAVYRHGMEGRCKQCNHKLVNISSKKILDSGINTTIRCPKCETKNRIVYAAMGDA